MLPVYEMPHSLSYANDIHLRIFISEFFLEKDLDGQLVITFFFWIISPLFLLLLLSIKNPKHTKNCHSL